MNLRLIRRLGIGLLALTLAACGQPATTGEGSAAESGDTGTDMSDMDHSDSADADVPFDAKFIDGMLEHHQSAIAMAQAALDQAEQPELKEMAQQIISAQQEEIEQMQAWREQWYPDLQETGGLPHLDMGDMEIGGDESKPFDQRFIEAMISHHQGAIDMAREAQSEAEHTEIRQLADQIIQAQEAEIQQMQAWQRQWFGE